MKNLTKGYENVSVYKNFNLSIPDKRITCILGESGCGKTTLLNCISGLEKYEGEITKCKCSYVFQTPRLLPNLTVLNNLKLVCLDEGKIITMLNAVGLGDKVNEYPNRLSGGQAQRVSLIRAFLFESDVILMDEPFSSLDLKLKKRIFDLFFSLWEKDGRTVVMVTHDPEEALLVGDRIVVINNGKVFYETDKKDFSGGRDKLIEILLNAALDKDEI